MRPPEFGSRLTARVRHSEHACVILQDADGREVFVDRTELFWPPGPTGAVNDLFPVGKELEVYVKGYIYPRRQVLGSIKRLHPEENPYRRLARLEPGTVLRGRVDLVPGQHEPVSIRLPDGLLGHLPSELLADKGGVASLTPGSEIDVVILHLDPDECRLVLSFPQQE